jgi:ABC-type spermidine/putrescine transport system permease subunit II
MYYQRSYIFKKNRKLHYSITSLELVGWILLGIALSLVRSTVVVILGLALILVAHIITYICYQHMYDQGHKDVFPRGEKK